MSERYILSLHRILKHGVGRYPTRTKILRALAKAYPKDKHLFTNPARITTANGGRSVVYTPYKRDRSHKSSARRKRVIETDLCSKDEDRKAEEAEALRVSETKKICPMCDGDEASVDAPCPDPMDGSPYNEEPCNCCATCRIHCEGEARKNALLRSGAVQQYGGGPNSHEV